ncbi:MAG: Uncharacterised protein [Alphaproteobacteria bacterium]|nr:MAG: Uncharacterised protein [Alphaproteobacteria bacterium]
MLRQTLHIGGQIFQISINRNADFGKKQDQRIKNAIDITQFITANEILSHQLAVEPSKPIFRIALHRRANGLINPHTRAEKIGALRIAETRHAGGKYQIIALPHTHARMGTLGCIISDKHGIRLQLFQIFGNRCHFGNHLPVFQFNAGQLAGRIGFDIIIAAIFAANQIDADGLNFNLFDGDNVFQSARIGRVHRCVKLNHVSPDKP